MKIILGRPVPADAPRLYWDSVWPPGDGYADFTVAGPDEPAPNIGGLQAQYPVETAIVLCLFCDARLPDDIARDLGDEALSTDRRGWIGDPFDLD